MSIEAILNRCEGVRKTGEGRWIARCPSRPDKHPSLSIRLLDDGRILLHDFGGDPVSDILHALGMNYGDLFPTAAHSHLPPVKRPFIASDVLRCLALDALIVLQCSNAMRRGEKLSDADHASLLAAVTHFQSAERICNA
ncbi:MAG: DNA primase [Burkholderiaceae bacterium]